MSARAVFLVASAAAYVPHPLLGVGKPLEGRRPAVLLALPPPQMLLGRLRNRQQKDSSEEEVAPSSAVEAVSESSDSLVDRADALHASKDVQAMFDLLAGEDMSDDEIAWRAARAHHDLAEEVVGDDSRKEQLLRDGVQIAETAMQASGSGYSLK